MRVVEGVHRTGGHVRVVEVGVALRVDGDHVAHVLTLIRHSCGDRGDGVTAGLLHAVERIDLLGHLGGQRSELTRCHGRPHQEVGPHGVVDDLADRGLHGGGDDRPGGHERHADHQRGRGRGRPARRRSKVAGRQTPDGAQKAQRHGENGDGLTGENRGADEQSEGESTCSHTQHDLSVGQVLIGPSGDHARQARGHEEGAGDAARPQGLVTRPRGASHGLHRRGEGGVARGQKGADDGHQQTDDNGCGDDAARHGHSPTGQRHAVGLQNDDEEAGQADPARDPDERSEDADDDRLEQHRAEHGAG